MKGVTSFYRFGLLGLASLWVAGCVSGTSFNGRTASPGPSTSASASPSAINSPQPSYSPGPVVSPKVVMVPQSTTKFLMNSSLPMAAPSAQPSASSIPSNNVTTAELQEVQQNALVFKANAQAEKSLKTGDILVGAQGDEGFMRKVVSVDKRAESVVVQTQQATLPEAFKELTISGLKPEYLNKTGFQTQQEQEVTAERFVKKEYKGLEFQFDGGVKLTADYEFKPDFFNFDLKIQDGKVYFKWSPSVELALKSELSVYIEGSVSKTFQNQLLKKFIKEHFRLAYVHWVPIPTPIPMAIPIVIRLIPSFAVDVDITGEGNIKVGGIDFKGKAESYVEIIGNTLKGGGNISSGVNWIKPAFNGSVSGGAKLYIPKLKFSVTVAGAIGPYIEVSPYGEVRIDSQLSESNCHLGINFGVEGEAGLGAEFEIPFLGISLGGKLSHKFLDWKHSPPFESLCDEPPPSPDRNDLKLSVE